MPPASLPSELTVRELRRRWKPHKIRLLAEQNGHPTVVRMHRTLSWLERARQAADGEDDDVRLVCLWIAFNAIYSRWDPIAREPLPDR